MAKPKIINSDLKGTISFSNFNRLDKQLKIAIRRKWSKLIINDVPEDKIEYVEDWINNNRGKYKGIIISLGSTSIRKWVLIFSSIDALEIGLNRAVKENFREILIDDVPEDQIKPIQNCIEKNKGKIEGVEVSIKPTLSGLTVEDEETFEMKYRAELDFNRVQLCENEIDKIQRYIDPEYPEDWKLPRLEEKLRWWQKLKKAIYKILRYSELEYPDEWKPPRTSAKLRWWKQKLKKAKAQVKINAAQLERENEAAKDNEKTAKKLEDAQPLLEKHSHIGKGRRKHNSLLNTFIDNFDKEFSKNRKKVPSATALESEMKKAITNNLGKHSFVIEVVDVNDCIKWRDDKGNIQSSAWGEAMRARITRIRKKRNNL